MRARKILGAIFLIFGVVFLLNSRITGFVIVEEISGNFGFVLSLIFFVVGVLLLIIGERESEGKLEKEVLETEHFKRAVRKHDLNAIRRAIEKIGTGLGNEEKLKLSGRGLYSIRASRGGRVIFEKDYAKGKEIVRLVDYLPAHEYNRLSA